MAVRIWSARKESMRFVLIERVDQNGQPVYIFADSETHWTLERLKQQGVELISANYEDDVALGIEEQNLGPKEFDMQPVTLIHCKECNGSGLAEERIDSLPCNKCHGFGNYVKK